MGGDPLDLEASLLKIEKNGSKQTLEMLKISGKTAYKSENSFKFWKMKLQRIQTLKENEFFKGLHL